MVVITSPLRRPAGSGSAGPWGYTPLTVTGRAAPRYTAETRRRGRRDNTACFGGKGHLVTSWFYRQHLAALLPM